MDTHKHRDEEHLPVDTELSDLERYQRESLLSAQKAYFSDQMKKDLETEVS